MLEATRNSGIILDDRGELRLYYRKLHPWVPVEPWEPGNLGIPVCDGPNGSRLSLIICHDGMFPEMARECVYKGADVIIRTAGYTAPIRHTWRITNQANAFCNLIYTASVCMCGSDGTFDSMGEGMIVGFDGMPLVEGGGRPDEIITGEIRLLRLPATHAQLPARGERVRQIHARGERLSKWPGQASQDAPSAVVR